MADFIAEYFINPMQYPEQFAPYNVFNTATYAIIALFFAFLIYKFISIRKIPINSQFYFAILPFILLGSVMRVIQDSGILPRSVQIFGITFFPFISPMIYIMMFLFLAASYLFSSYYSKNNFQKMFSTLRTIGVAAIILAFLFLFATNFQNINPGQIWFVPFNIGLALLAVAFFEIIKKFLYNKGNKQELSGMERITVFSQSFDGVATFIGVALGGYSEQHVLANSIFAIFGTPIAFYFIKVIFAITVVFVLRKEAKSESEHVFVLTLITLFGLAPGMRDALRLFFLV